MIKDFVKESWVNEIDFSTLEKVNTDFTSQYFEDRKSDVVYKVNYGAEKLYIYILVEFQSSVEKNMAVKVLTYMMLLYQDLIKQGLVKDKLPFVFPLVLYNADSKWTAPVAISDLIQIPAESLNKYIVNFTYNLVSVNELNMETLSELRDGITTLFYLENSKGIQFDNDIEKISDAIYSLTDKSLRKELFDYICGFIKRKKFDNVDLDNIVKPEVRTMLRTSMEEYKKDLEEKAKLEKQKEIVRKMLRKGSDISFISEVTDLTEEEIKKIKID